ncbi:MAG: Chromosomal replication initiator protein DnaA [Thermoleophilia bacterium]|nr:Chromosomal replication initiator protein DnaA [Thermoleophilia bacterium]
MVDDSVRGFWSQVAEALRDRISSQDWCSWFAGAQAVELGAERIVVEVVNDFAARWVDERFRGVLQDTVAQVAGVPLEVVIVARVGAPVDIVGPEDGPHEDLARAARAHVSHDVVAPVGVGGGDDPGVGRSNGDVMTSAQLRAELAAGDLLPSMTLDAGAATDAAAHPAPYSGGMQHADGASIAAPRMVVDADLAGVQQLNDKYRFETFVIGPGNQMVHAAALSVAESPAQSYNPLFVHGGTGLGKTHLLHAIGNYVRDTRPDARIAYITTEQFLARFLHAIQQSKLGGAGRDTRDRFKAYFRGVDVLLMDDVQFLAGKGSWMQEELFHIFNDLHQGGRQIVLTSDCKPDRIPKLEDRLRSRFAWGLIADIDTPDRETRVAILRKKAQSDQFAELPAEVLEAIAERITTNVRELEGALTRVVAAASLSNRPVTLELATSVLESYAPEQSTAVTIERIQDVVCEHFALDRDELLSPRRTQSLTLPRQIGMYLSRTLVGAPSTQVARRFNRKDHSTVLHAERQVDEKMRKDREVHDLVVHLTQQVRSGTAGSVGAGR